MITKTPTSRPFEDRYFKTRETSQDVIAYLDDLLEIAVEKRYQELYNMCANMIWRTHVKASSKWNGSINSLLPEHYELAGSYFPRQEAYRTAQKDEFTYVQLNGAWNILLDDMNVSSVPYPLITKGQSVEESLFEDHYCDLARIFRKYGHMHFVEGLEANSALNIAQEVLLFKMEDTANRAGNAEASRKFLNAVKALDAKSFELNRSNLRPFTMDDFFVSMDTEVYYELPPDLAEKTLVSLILR